MIEFDKEGKVMFCLLYQTDEKLTYWRSIRVMTNEVQKRVDHNEVFHKIVYTVGTKIAS